MNFRYLLWDAQQCANNQGQEDSGALILCTHYTTSQEPVRSWDLAGHICQKSVSLVHFRRLLHSVTVVWTLATGQQVCHPSLPVETSPLFPELITALTLQVALLDFHQSVFRVRPQSRKLVPTCNYSTNTVTPLSGRSHCYLLRYDLYTIKLTILKCTTQQFVVHLQGCATSLSDSRTLSSPCEEPPLPISYGFTSFGHFI